MRRRLVVLLTALALDGILGDLPNRWHPVARFGRGAGRVRRLLPYGSPARDLASGLVLAALPVGVAVIAAAVGRALRRLPAPLAVVAEAVALKQALALRGLVVHGLAVQRPLAAGDLDRAREAVAMVVSRDCTALDGAGVASAAIESITENTSDSVVAPACWYLVGGLPAGWGYRATNTLDAMVGYRPFGLLGTPVARADDLLNFVPARLTALLSAIASLHPVRVLTGVWQDGGATASPNSGWPMAAGAHALGVRLEKEGYHVLAADGAPPSPADIRRAAFLAVRTAAAGAGMVAAGLAWTARPGGRGR